MVSTNEISSLKNLVSIENLPFETEIVALSPASLLEVATKKQKKENSQPKKNLFRFTFVQVKPKQTLKIKKHGKPMFLYFLFKNESVFAV